MANKMANASYYMRIQCFGEVRIWCKKFTSGCYHYWVLHLSYLEWIAFHKSGLISLISILIYKPPSHTWEAGILSKPCALPPAKHRQAGLQNGWRFHLIHSWPCATGKPFWDINTKPTASFSGGNGSVHNTCLYKHCLGSLTSHSINNAKGLWDRLYGL